MDAKQFDRPDIYVSLNDKVLAIEHFEFDASNKTRSGSRYRKEEISSRSYINEYIESNYSGNPLLYSEQIGCNLSSDFYIANMKSAFMHHYLKIDEYKRHLIEKGIAKSKDDIISCFFIEDVTLLGCYYIDYCDDRKISHLIYCL